MFINNFIVERGTFFAEVLNTWIRYRIGNGESNVSDESNRIPRRFHLLDDRVSRDSRLAERSDEGTEVINNGYQRVGSLFHFLLLHCTIVHLLRARLAVTLCAVLV